MDDEQGQEECTDDTSLVQLESPYMSEDSRFSDDSYTVNDILMESSSYDVWEDDSYYDLSESYEDSTYDSLPRIIGEPEPLDQAIQEASIISPPTVVIDDTLEEENNNDPNNNMDSVEIISAEDNTSVVIEETSEAKIPIVRADSPVAGCSKDSLLLPSIDEKSLDDDVTLERTRHVLHLLSTIHRDSVYEIIKKNPKITVGDLRLWDLVPENERNDFPTLDARTIKTEPYDPTWIKAECMSPESLVAAATVAAGTTACNSKRGPQDDICTVGCKKSSSNPEIAIVAPKIQQIPAKTAVATSHIPLPAAKPSMIPKIRRDDYSQQRDKNFAYPTHLQYPPVAMPRSTASAYVPQPTITAAQPKRSNVDYDHPYTFNPRNGAVPKSLQTDLYKQSYPKQQPQNVTTSVNYATTFQPNRVYPNPVAGYRYNQFHDYNKLPPVNPAPREYSTANVYANTAEAALPTIVRHAAATAAATAATTAVQPAVPKIQRPPAATVSTTSEERQPQQHQQSTNRVYCRDIYYKLRNIFPNVDADYIKKLCPAESKPGNVDAHFTEIVEYMLERSDTLPLAPVKIEDNGDGENNGIMATGNVDDIYETLLGIFPDADPHFLRDFADKNVAKPNAVKEFVESKLERRDYPTREMYLKRLKITEQQRQYTTGFEIKQYLTIIPDPFKHFMDAKRKCIYSTVAFEFLKSYFNKIKVATISRAYTQCRYNLSATAESLQITGYEMKSKRGGIEIPTEDILLLQEIAFIKHKTKIREYMVNLKREEEAEFKMLKEQNFLVECQCCYDSECMPSKCTACDKGHLFCNNCVISGTNSKLGDGETRIYCFINCGSEFSLAALQQVIAPTTFSILLKKRQAAEVIEAGLEGLVSCPFCHFASIPPEEDKVFKCLNPECTKESCRLCKELSHVPLKCDEVMKADKARCYIEEKMTEALARKCYKCQRAFFKEEGCNRIYCPCGASMCYLCDAPIKDYTHFRGQGSNATNLCPLYSDTIRLDAVAVRKVGEEAQKEVLKMHPNVKVDATKLLPNIPRATNGPHTAVYNADEMPRRAQRVLDRNPL